MIRLISYHLFWRHHPDLNRGIKLLQSSALPLGYGAVISAEFQHFWSGLRDLNSLPPPWQGGALPDELNPHWCFRTESNHRHGDFQSPALPTELQKHMATRNGIEPSTSCVTGRRSNQLNYRAKLIKIGGSNRARTCDPLLVGQMLFQLSYTPIAQNQRHL